MNEMINSISEERSRNVLVVCGVIVDLSQKRTESLRLTLTPHSNRLDTIDIQKRYTNTVPCPPHALPFADPRSRRCNLHVCAEGPHLYAWSLSLAQCMTLINHLCIPAPSPRNRTATAARTRPQGSRVALPACPPARRWPDTCRYTDQHRSSRSPGFRRKEERTPAPDPGDGTGVGCAPTSTREGSCPRRGNGPGFRCGCR